MVRETSREAYEKIKENDLLSTRRWQVYDVLFSVGPATGGEVFREMKRRYGMTIPTNSNTTTRLGELRERGVVKELGTRACDVSGQRVILWDVTKKLPVTFDKPSRIKCKSCCGKGYIEVKQAKFDL